MSDAREQKAAAAHHRRARPLEDLAQQGNVDYYFVLNHAAEPVTVSPGAGYVDALEDRVAAKFQARTLRVRVLKKGNAVR